MKKPILALSLFVVLVSQIDIANAKGCAKGAAVGGVAGHVAGKHGAIGAATGCAVGHHRAAKQEKSQKAAAEQSPPTPSQGVAPTPGQ